MSKTTKTVLWILLGVIVVGGLGYWTVQNSKSKKTGIAVEYGEAKRMRIEERVSASGRIFPVTEIAISSDVSGEVVELLVAEGDSVIQGQLLARIDPDAIESQVSRGRAAVNAAKANGANSEAAIEQAIANRKQLDAQLIVAKQVLARNEGLVKEGLLSTAELEQAQNSIATLGAQIEAADASVKAAQASARAAKFNVESAQASLRELSTNLSRTNVKAPMTGVVSLLNIEQGERVVGTMQMAGTEMARIADLSKMEVQVEVSENDIPRVTVSDEVEIEVDAYLDRTFKGKVTEISNSANNLVSGAQSLSTDQVTNFVVTISILPESYKDLITPTRPYPFRPGMSAAVDILTEVEKDALAVPIASVTAREVEKDEDDESTIEGDEEDLEEVVWVITATEEVERAVVKTGIQDRRNIMILSGLNAGDKVVVGPYSAVSRKLDDGDKVYEKEEEEKEEKDDDED
ncbi:MAG: efflux RND transporter periplasmic adaptor subunit [Saprospiraceae bacterium]